MDAESAVLGIFAISPERRSYYLRRAVVDALIDHGPLLYADLVTALRTKYVLRGVVPESWYDGIAPHAVLERLRGEGVIEPFCKGGRSGWRMCVRPAEGSRKAGRKPKKKPGRGG